MKAIIVDDEEFARSNLRSLLSIYCPQVEVLDDAATIEEAFEKIKELSPDVLFLDIHLGEDETSFHLLEKFQEKNFQIVFTSGHSEFGVAAFKVNATDYLLKPIDGDDLEVAVNKVAEKMKLEQNQHELMFPTHVNGQVELIPASQICSLQAQNNYTQLITITGKRPIVSKTLGDLEDFLKDCSTFVRIHKSVIINSQYLTRYSKTDPCIVFLSDGSSFEVSRRKKAEVLSFLKKDDRLIF